MEYAVKTLQQAIQHFADPENCREFMVFMRWPDGKVALPLLRCSQTDLAGKGEGLPAATASTQRRSSRSRSGTIFEDSPIGLEKWLPAVWLLSTARMASPAMKFTAPLGVTQKTAWFMLHRIRLAMEPESF